MIHNLIRGYLSGEMISGVEPPFSKRKANNPILRLVPCYTPEIHLQEPIHNLSLSISLG